MTRLSTRVGSTDALRLSPRCSDVNFDPRGASVTPVGRVETARRLGETKDGAPCTGSIRLEDQALAPWVNDGALRRVASRGTNIVPTA